MNSSLLADEVAGPGGDDAADGACATSLRRAPCVFDGVLSPAWLEAI